MMVFNETPDMSVLSPDMLKSVLDQSGMAGAAGGGGPGGSKQNSAYNCGNPNGNGNVAKTNVVLWSWFGFGVAEYNEYDVCMCEL